MHYLGVKVKNLRYKRGMNQKELADASQITQATISRLEGGKVKELKTEALMRLSKALGVTMDYLGGKTNQQSPSDVLQADPSAQFLFRGYEKLSLDNRNKLITFLRFLESEEQKDREEEEITEIVSKRKFRK